MTNIYTLIALFVFGLIAVAVVPGSIKNQGHFKKSLWCAVAMFLGHALSSLVLTPKNKTTAYTQLENGRITQDINDLAAITAFFYSFLWVALALGLWWLLTSTLTKETRSDRARIRDDIDRKSPSELRQKMKDQTSGGGHKTLGEIQKDPETP